MKFAQQTKNMCNACRQVHLKHIQWYNWNSIKLENRIGGQSEAAECKQWEIKAQKRKYDTEPRQMIIRPLVSFFIYLHLCIFFLFCSHFTPVIFGGPAKKRMSCFFWRAWKLYANINHSWLFCNILLCRTLPKVTFIYFRSHDLFPFLSYFYRHSYHRYPPATPPVSHISRFVQFASRFLPNLSAKIETKNIRPKSVCKGPHFWCVFFILFRFLYNFSISSFFLLPVVPIVGVGGVVVTASLLSISLQDGWHV